MEKESKGNQLLKNLGVLLGMFMLWLIPQFLIGVLINVISNGILLALLQILILAAGILSMVIWAKKLKIAKFSLDWFTKTNLKWILLIFLLSRIIVFVYGIFNSEQTANDSMLQTLPINKVVLFFMVVVEAPICEEIIFRGCLLGRLFKDHLIIGLIISSFLFSCMHASTTLISFLLYMILGAMFAVPYIKSQRLETSIATHFLNNLIGGIFLFIS